MTSQTGTHRDGAAVDPTGPTAVAAEADGIADELRRLRRELHRHPELGGELPRTQAAIVRRLEALGGLEITTGRRQSSVTAVLRGAVGADGRRPVVLLRGDMDALPVTEETGLDFASVEPGRMHACGHDLHVACLYGAARILHAHRDRLAADVVFMFQPGEEVSDGAEQMIEDGVLTAAGRRADAAYGLHVFSAVFDPGVFYSRPGAVMAGADEFLVTVHGTGGHSSTPHLAVDPVPVAAEMVVALQTLVTRHYDVFDPVIATVGHLQAGTAGNVIPDEAEFNIVTRTFSPATRERLIHDVTRLVEGIAAAHGMGASWTMPPTYPVTVNDAAEYRFARSALRGLYGEGGFVELEHPMTASEDFSHVLAQVPGVFLALGARVGDGGQMNHSSRAVFDDAVLPRGAAALAALALLRPGWTGSTGDTGPAWGAATHATEGTEGS